MNSVKEALKELLQYIKSNPFYCVLFMAVVCFAAYAYYNDQKKEKIQKNELSSIYVINKDDGIFSLKGEKLKKTQTMIVVSPDNASSKDVVVREVGKESATIYKDVTREEYFFYNEAILTPFIKENQTFDFKYAKDYKDIGKSLGLKKEPVKLDTPNSEAESSVLKNLLNFLPIFIILIFFLLYSNKTTTTKADEILPKDIHDDLDDLVGLEDIKAELLQLEDMYLNREVYLKYNAAKNFNVMMTGAAGVGKTKIARCLAKRLDIPMIYGSAAGLQSGYVGGGARALKALVKKASKYKRAIIFLDEGESLFKNRASNSVKDYESETINAFLAILDGVNTKNSGIIWMVASNMDEHKTPMDAAMLRRFHLKINFRLPNFEGRKKVIERLIGQLDSEVLSDDIEVNKLAGISSGMSPALLETMVNRAGLIAVKDKTKVSQEVLMKAFERVAVGLTDRETTGDMDDKRMLVARHEAGHFILKLHDALIKSKGQFSELKDHIDVIKISTESVSKMGALGFVLSREKELNLETLTDYEGQIKQLYGGMANEEIYYGVAGVTAGAHNDIEKISHLLRVMVCEVGFYQEAKLNYSVITQNKEVHETQLNLMQEKSKVFYEDTKEILIEHKGLTDQLVDVLMKEYVLNIDDALKHVEHYFNEKGGVGSTYAEHIPTMLSA